MSPAQDVLWFQEICFEFYQLTRRCEVSGVTANRKIYNGIFLETDNNGF